MSILDNEGHDPRGLGNNPTYIETRNKIAAAREKQFAEARADNERLRAAVAKAIDILDRNLWHQTEKCEDAVAILRKAISP